MTPRHNGKPMSFAVAACPECDIRKLSLPSANFAAFWAKRGQVQDWNTRFGKNGFKRRISK